MMCVSQPNESAVMLRLMMFADMHVTHMLFAFSESGALARSTLRSTRCCVISIQRTGSRWHCSILLHVSPLFTHLWSLLTQLLSCLNSPTPKWLLSAYVLSRLDDVTVQLTSVFGILVVIACIAISILLLAFETAPCMHLCEHNTMLSLRLIGCMPHSQYYITRVIITIWALSRW